MRNDPGLICTMQSAVPGIHWPPLASGEGATLAALTRQLDQSQWLPAEAIVEGQYRQLARTAAHAASHSTYFRRRIEDAGLRPQDLCTREDLRRLPVMRRRDVQSAGETLFCAQVPRTHAPVAQARTSGSSGEPVTIKRTAVSQLMWMAMTMREHLWQRRDFRGRLAVIRANLPGEKLDRADWGPPASLLFATGTSHGCAITTDLARQIDWLMAIDPDYLLIYPTNLAALLDLFEQRGQRLARLRQIRTMGETLIPEVRAAAQRVLGAGIADTYSSEEVGVIALQCPASGLYHTMAESLIVEVLGEQDQPCGPGEVGRVVVTDLHNFATPLIRYEIGDYGEATDACPCGRGLPALRRISGRSRNMVRLPDGRTFWPLVGFARYRDIAPVRQYQLVQRDLDTIEVRVVMDSPLTAEQEQKLRDLIRKSLGFPFNLQFTCFTGQIPRGPGGKFEEFVCELA